MEIMDVLTRAGCFIAIIFLGYILRRVNFFKEGEFHVLSKIVLKITLPAAIITSLANKEISPSLLFISLIGLGGGIIYISIILILNNKAAREEKAFRVLNCCGYNIGNFTLPFVQSFFGPVGVLTTSLFDIGNACICLGGAYSLASVIKGDEGDFKLSGFIRSLFKSIPFDTYVVMTILGLLKIPLPVCVTSFAGIISNANAFMAMLMIGVGFKLAGDTSQMKAIMQILSVRYSVGLVIALACLFLLPMPIEYRQALALLPLSPIASSAPAFTADLKGDIGLSSAINSISIVISIALMVGMLLLAAAINV